MSDPTAIRRLRIGLGSPLATERTSLFEQKPNRCQLGQAGSCKLTTAFAQAVKGVEVLPLPSGLYEVHMMARFDPASMDGELFQQMLSGAGFGKGIEVRQTDRSWLRSVL